MQIKFSILLVTQAACLFGQAGFQPESRQQAGYPCDWQPGMAGLLFLPNRAGTGDVFLDCLWIAGVSDFPRSGDGDLQCLANRDFGLSCAGRGDFGRSGLETAGVQLTCAGHVGEELVDAAIEFDMRRAG